MISGRRPDSGASAEAPGDTRARRRHAWLALGACLDVVANGRWILPGATWIAPIGWLVYLDRSRLLRGVATALPLYVALEFVRWRGLIPAPGILYYLITGTYAVVYFLPFAVHRLVAPRLRGIPATLVFPAAWVGIEFVFQKWGTPYGSWFSLAYTQSSHLAFLQSVSLAGTPGPSFLITWFASAAAWMMRPGHLPGERARVAAVYGGILIAVLVYGQIRLAEPGREGEVVRVAGLVPARDLTARVESHLRSVRAGGAAAVRPEELQAIAADADRLNDDLFSRTLREARAGARLVAWSETAGRVLARDEAGMLERARRLASEEHVDLLLAYGVWTPGARPPFANRIAAIRADGELAWTHDKAHPIAGAETPLIAAGTAEIPRLVTAWGSVGGAICHDLDFPDLFRRTQREGIGLLVGPSADWPDITPLHADMAVPRAIENGFSLFRPTSGGRSIAADSRGRTLARVDYARDAIVAWVPTGAPARTLYGYVGDLIAWLSLAGLAVLGVLSVFRREGRP
jgi:apolipoprotein N-acyltransferase